MKVEAEITNLWELCTGAYLAIKKRGMGSYEKFYVDARTDENGDLTLRLTWVPEDEDAVGGVE